MMLKILSILLLLTLMACKKDRYYVGAVREVRIIEHEMEPDSSLYYGIDHNWIFVGSFTNFYIVDKTGTTLPRNVREDLKTQWRQRLKKSK